VGALFATFSFCQLASAPIWGNVSDRIGRKMVLIISQVGATIGWTMLAYAPQLASHFALPVLGVIFVARVVEGVSGGNISITQAYVADLVEAKDRSRAFGLIGAMFGLGMVVGPAAGGLLFSAFGFAAPFLAAAFMQLVTLLVTIFMLPESRTKLPDEEHVGLTDIFTSFQKPRLRPLLFQKLAIALALYGWFGVYALYLQRQLGFTLAGTYYFFSAFAVFNVFCNAFLVSKVSNALGDRKMSTLGLASLLVGFSIVPAVHTIPILAVTMLLFGFGMALTNTGITALISNAASDREQGTVLGTSSSLDSLSGIVAPPISTGVLGAWGPQFAGIESAAFSALALLMGVIAGRGEEAASVPASHDAGRNVLGAEVETAEIAEG
jgi:DHA1 family tetracycline resistance protein-like MFS transporter